MVAKFRGGKSLRHILTYNECKVTAGVAVLIGEGGYGKDHADLTFQEKLARLTDLARRNWRTMNNAMHISLSFSRQDELDDRKLNLIVKDYLECIGFGGQPYLVYKHLDTAHPHVHVVSTNIDRAGKNIDLYLRCFGKSFRAARDLEKKYSLKYACEPREAPLRMFGPPPVEYGISDLWSGISDVVKQVVNSHRVTNLTHFNLVLGQYNVLADRGSETSEMYANGGLLYRAIKNGKRIGVPVKASSIEGKPTLKLLQSLFLRNEAVRLDRREFVLKRLDTIICTNTSQSGFLTSLRLMGISTVLHYSDRQELRDITYIDNFVGAVFSGNDLGRAYGAAELSSRFFNFEEVLPRLRAAGSGPDNSRSYTYCAIRDGHNWKSLRESQEKGLRQGLRISH